VATKSPHIQAEAQPASKLRQAASTSDRALQSGVNDAAETSADRWLHLQQTIGNQAVGRLLSQSAVHASEHASTEPVAVQREDKDEWKFKPLPPELSYNPTGSPFSGTLSPGGVDLGLGQYHLSGGGSPVDGSWNASAYYGSPLLPFPGDVTRDVNAGMAGLGSGNIGPALNMASTLGSLGTSPTMPFGAGVTASSTPDDPLKLMFGVQGSF
jgi:hypothetical protein